MHIGHIELSLGDGLLLRPFKLTNLGGPEYFSVQAASLKGRQVRVLHST